MKGRFKKFRGMFQLLVFAMLCSLFETGLAQDLEVLVVKSNNNRFFNSSIESMINRSEGIRFMIHELDDIQQHSSDIDKFDQVIALGFDAAQWLNQASTKVPVLYSYITGFQFNRLPSKAGHQALLLEQPLERYLRFILNILPIKRLGLVHSEGNEIDANILESLQQQFGIEIQQQRLDDDGNAIVTVRKALSDTDVLLSLPDSQVYNQRTLKGILLTSYRQKKPIISYSPAHVKSGALAAIYSSPDNIGQQLAWLLVQANTLQTSEGTIHYTRDFNIEINQQVATSLRLDLPDKKELLSRLKAP